MSERAAILEANRRYSQTFGEKGELPLPPARRIAILTCMDARLDPAAYAGLQEGDAHVIRTDVGEGPGSSAGNFINWLTISDLRQSVIDDVRRIREHPLVPGRIPIHGFIYQVETGELIEVPEASAIGASR